MSQMITRIAPSPTGDPHVGTAYMSLFDYVAARQSQGKFIFRLEDTDQERYNPESEKILFEMLHWLGLSPDESPETGGANGPYRQSERLDIYKKYAEQLVAEGKAYRAFETSEELETISTELKRLGKGWGYDGRARNIPSEEAQKRAKAGEAHVIRLKVPRDRTEVVVQDGLRGDITIPTSEVVDAVLLKSDGFPTYHLAVVVDDHLMGITDVVRGEEWISTAPIHVLLYEMLGWEAPNFYHMPLLLNTDKTKLSKRKGNTSVKWYKEQGIVAEALLNYLATMGWSMPNGKEFFSLKDMINNFSFKRVSLGGSVFDLKRLWHYNAHYLREVLPIETIIERAKPFLKDADYTWTNERYIEKVVEVLLPRIETLKDIADQSYYFFNDDFGYTEDAKRRLEAGSKYLEDLERELSRLDYFDHDEVLDSLRDYAREQSVKLPEVMQPLRAALTGTTQAPGVTELCEILGKQKVLERIGRAIEGLNANLPDDKPVKPSKDKEKDKDKDKEAA
ncbi:MAG: glutamate--tRNA ligase [Trueperaceae bacterium]